MQFTLYVLCASLQELRWTILSLSKWSPLIFIFLRFCNLLSFINSSFIIKTLEILLFFILYNFRLLLNFFRDGNLILRDFLWVINILFRLLILTSIFTNLNGITLLFYYFWKWFRPLFAFFIFLFFFLTLFLFLFLTLFLLDLKSVWLFQRFNPYIYSFHIILFKTLYWLPWGFL